MKVALGNLFVDVAPLIEKSIPSLQSLKRFLEDGYSELHPRLSTAESFDDVMELIEEKCTIINICCLELIVERYNIEKAKEHIKAYKSNVVQFCEEIKLSVGELICL